MVNQTVQQIVTVCRRIGSSAKNNWANTVVYNFHVWLEKHLILTTQEWNSYMLGGSIDSYGKWLLERLNDMSTNDTINQMPANDIIYEFDSFKRPLCWRLIHRWIVTWKSRDELIAGGIDEVCSEVVERIVAVVQQAQQQVTEKPNPHDGRHANERKVSDPLRILNVLDSVGQALSRKERDPTIYERFEEEMKQLTTSASENEQKKPPRSHRRVTSQSRVPRTLAPAPSRSRVENSISHRVAHIYPDLINEF
ncbi:hypothetical protein JCM5350_000648 [Sporobolomyces pararoseus]